MFINGAGREFIIKDTHRGLYYEDGKLTKVLEAGCLHRAWVRFQSRAHLLRTTFGQLVPSVQSSAADLWHQMRLAKGSLERILNFLADTAKISLLGNYRCLQLPG